MSVEFKASNRDRLIETIKMLGWGYDQVGTGLRIRTPDGYYIIIKDNKAELDESQQNNLNQLKKAYSAKAVEEVAKKYKFNLINKGGKLIARRY